MKLLTYLTPLLFISLPVLASEISLMVGEQKKILSKSTQATVTNSAVLVVKKENHGFVLIGKKPGEAHLKLGVKEAMTVIVYSAKLRSIKREVEEITSNSPNIISEVTPQKIRIKGVLENTHDWILLADISQKFNKLIDWQPSASEEVLKLVKNKIQSDLKNLGTFSVSVEIKDQTLQIFEGKSSPRDKQIALEVTRKWALPPPQTTDSLELRPMVEIEITIAEIKKNNFKNLGLQLPGSYSATLLPSVQLDPLGAQLNAQLENNRGKIVANPKIICRSGETAHFIAGGEIPIKIMNFKINDVVWKKYGVILDITPRADFKNDISTKLVTEISLIDEAHKVDSIPGFLTNRIETHFDLKGEKTIALSGLIKNELGRGDRETPLLSSIPIIGEIFKSKEYKDNRTEMIILVTPRVISPENAPAQPTHGFWNDDL